MEDLAWLYEIHQDVFLDGCAHGSVHALEPVYELSGNAFRTLTVLCLTDCCCRAAAECRPFWRVMVKVWGSTGAAVGAVQLVARDAG